MLEAIRFLIQGIQKFLVPICFIGAWTLMILVVWGLWSAARDTVATAKKMRQIPCPGCQFFTADYRLKCTVHPSVANTEEAIDCIDYQPKSKNNQ